MKAYLYALIVAFIWSSFATIATLLIQNLDPLQVLFYSSIFSVLTLFSFALYQKKLESVKKFVSKKLLIIVIMSVLGPFSFFYLVSTSFEIIPTSEGLMLSFTWPLIMVIFSFPILKEKLTLRKIGAILISLFGVILIITKGQTINIFTNLYGDLLALTGGISWALYSVLCKKFKYHSISNQFVFRLFALIYTIVLIPFFSNFFIPSIYQLMGFMWIGIFNMGIAVVLWFKALEMGNTAKIANITYLIPFISLVWIFLVLKEQIQLISVVGLILVILGVLIQD